MKQEKFTLDFPKIEEADQSASNQSRRTLLESTRLSRLPNLPKRSEFKMPDFSPTKPAQPLCIGCGGRLEFDNDLQQSIKSCRKCIGIYARLDVAFDEVEKRKRRERLEKFIGGAGND